MTCKLAIRSAFVLALCAALPAQAATDCAQAMQQADLNRCAADGFKREDARLNTLYKELVGRSDKAEAGKLRQAQRAWISFRDLHCQYEQSRYQGGSMAPLVHATCLGNLTRQRNDTLQAVIKDFH